VHDIGFPSQIRFENFDNHRMKKIVFLFLTLCFAFNSQGQSPENQPPIIFIYDASGSMWGQMPSKTKMEGIDFKLHIIGFGLKSADTQQLRCAAKAGEGRYFRAENPENLGEILNVATTSTVKKPANNFSVYAIKNGLPLDVYVKAYDIIAKRTPILLRTYQDTGYFYLPPSKYNFEVVPLEGRI